MGCNNRTMGRNIKLQNKKNKKINRKTVEGPEYCDCLLFIA